MNSTTATPPVRDAASPAPFHGSRAQAIAAGAVRYFNGGSCKAGHDGIRYTVSGSCVTCQRLATTANKLAARQKRNALRGGG